jgi:hypothetical protein
MNDKSVVGLYKPFYQEPMKWNLKAYKTRHNANKALTVTEEKTEEAAEKLHLSDRGICPLILPLVRSDIQF